MRNLRTIPVIAIALIVVLRIFIGWQFFYEGVWKLKTLNTAQPWTSAGYLKNAQGPLRQTFREMSGDPDDLNWLDADAVSARWDDWLGRFKQHHSDLTEEQTKQLDLLLDGPADFRAVLDQLPEGVEIRGSLGQVIRFDAKRKRLIVDGKKHLTPKERERLLRMVNVEENPDEADAEKNEQARQFQQAVRDVFERSSRLSFKERLRASLIGDPERAGLIDEKQAGTIDYKRLGQIELYKAQLARYEANRARADSRAIPIEAQIVSKARPSSVPSFPKKVPYAVLIGIAVLLFGIAIVVTRALFTAAREPGDKGAWSPEASALIRAGAKAPAVANQPSAAKAAGVITKIDTVDALVAQLLVRPPDIGGFRTLIKELQCNVTTFISIIHQGNCFYPVNPRLDSGPNSPDFIGIPLSNG